MMAGDEDETTCGLPDDDSVQEVSCKCERLNEEGYCRRCGRDRRRG